MLLGGAAVVGVGRGEKELSRFLELEVELIDPSPYQKRQRFKADSLRRLADDIELNGLLNPILCRTVNGRYELVHGERRWRAVKLIPWATVPTQVREMTDMEARRICAAENVHREDLTPVELIEATVEWVDACLAGTGNYDAFGETPLDRVTFLLGKFNTDVRHSTGHYVNSASNFASKVDIAFEAMNRGITWHSFFRHDLRPYLKLDGEVKGVAIDHSLAKSKAFALQELKDAAPGEFEKIKETGQVRVGLFEDKEYDIEEVSARELRQKAGRRHTLGVMGSSESPEWYTPKNIVRLTLKLMGKIDLDPCSNSHENPNVPAGTHYAKRDNGLVLPWFGKVYMNPPYGDEISGWTEKLVESYERGDVKEAIALLPGRIDTHWFQPLYDYLICNIRGRLQFVGSRFGAPFPSVIVYMGKNEQKFIRIFKELGPIVKRIA